MAAKKWALIIGNAQSTSIDVVQSSTRDADAIAKKLIDLKFEVLPEHNLDLKSTIATRLHFIQKLIAHREETGRVVDVALVYYSGYGLSIGGKHYMVPVDYTPAAPYDINFYDYIELNSFVSELDRHAQTVIVLFDPCRSSTTEAFANEAHSFHPALPTAAMSRAQADIQGSAGKFIIFSTNPGGVPFDGSYAYHRPFGQAFLDNIECKSDDIITFANKMRMDVRRTTNYKENIDYTDKLKEPFFFHDPVSGNSEADVSDKPAIPVDNEVKLTVRNTHAVARMAAALAIGLAFASAPALLLAKYSNFNVFEQVSGLNTEPIALEGMTANIASGTLQIVMPFSEMQRLGYAADSSLKCPATTDDRMIERGIPKDAVRGSKSAYNPLKKITPTKGGSMGTSNDGDQTAAIEERELSSLSMTSSEVTSALPPFRSTNQSEHGQSWKPVLEYTNRNRK